MSNSKSDSSQVVYAAAQGREFLRNELKGKSNEWVREFAGLVDSDETLDLLNYYCSLWSDEGENFLESHLGRELLTTASTRTINDAYREGNVSQLQGMVGLTNNAKSSDDFWNEAQSRLSEEGTICFIVGPPGTGKSSLGADLVRATAARTNAQIVANQTWDAADEHVTNEREMFEAMAEHEGQSISFIDELSKKLTGYGTDLKPAKEFAGRMTLLRKKERKHGPHAKRGTFVGVAHGLGRLAPDLKDIATMFIEKPTPNDRGLVRIYESLGEDSMDLVGEFKGVSDTRERLDEHDPAEFSIVGDKDGEENAADEAVAEAERKQADKHRQIETAIRAVVRGDTYPDAAELVDYKDSWVGNRYREWLNGEHRDLVPLDDFTEGTLEGIDDLVR